MEKEEGGLCNGSEAELVCQRREQSAFMEETDSKLGLLEWAFSKNTIEVLANEVIGKVSQYFEL